MWTWNCICFDLHSFRTISDSQVLQNTCINIVAHWKFLRKYRYVSCSLSCIDIFWPKLNLISYPFHINLTIHIAIVPYTYPHLISKRSVRPVWTMEICKMGGGTGNRDVDSWHRWWVKSDTISAVCALPGEIWWGEGHCVLKWVLLGHFLGIMMPQWN